MKSIAVVLALIGCVYGVPEWTNLRTTWSLNPFNTWGFDSLPRDLSGKLEDFVLRDNQCDMAGAKFAGQRYWYKQDPAVSLLFDKQGIIAGIQTSMAKSDYTPPAYAQNLHYIDDGDYWTLTAYFVDPSTICSTGRTADQFKADGTGTGLYLQQGPDFIKDSVLIPLTEDDVKTQTKWTFGHCFKTMGNHYWYNVTKDMPGDHFVPTCLLYNKGKLTAFCFAVNSALKSQRYEHPTASVLPKFLDPVPDFFTTDPAYASLSTMHVYFSSHPRVDTFC
jgi:charged multivesicular body protein 7